MSDDLIDLNNFDFCVAKIKKRKQRKKTRVSKQKRLKGNYQSQNVSFLSMLEHLEFINLSCWPWFQCFMVPPLRNSFHWLRAELHTFWYETDSHDASSESDEDFVL